jgi:predicted alpha/beta hydrolase
MSLVAAPPTRAFLGENVAFAAADGRRLRGRLLAGPDPAAAVVVHPATGVPAGYYLPFAEWLADTHNVAVLLYDYRDFGWSDAVHPRQSRASMSDWGLLDQSGALDFALDRFPDRPVRVLGHSLGGMWMAFHARIAEVDRAVAVASGPAYWLHHPLRYMPAVVAFWWLIGPVATATMGYLPGKRIGLGADLPKAVYWQWRRWCLSPRFARIDLGKTLPMPDVEAARFDLTLIAAADDLTIPPAMARQLADFYPRANVREDILHPAASGGRAIGHLGMFTKGNRAIWPRLAAPLITP